jgi:hypothetical protein
METVPPAEPGLFAGCKPAKPVRNVLDFNVSVLAMSLVAGRIGLVDRRAPRRRLLDERQQLLLV